MYGFWDWLTRPALEALGAREIVEIGSERGRQTERLLQWCESQGARLHVIEPEPRYDPVALAASRPGTLVFHESTSLEVLPALGASDAVLIDGDHNWYTVYHELKALEKVNGANFPLVLLHDVAWPFARRDMYYEPGRIPGEYRQPYLKLGVKRGQSQLVDPPGGFVFGLHKAVEEGGPRNGVLTAVEDFMRESALPLRLEILPIDFGLGVLASEVLQQRRPALRELLDSLHQPDFGRRLALHLEERRVDGLIELSGEIARATLEVATVVGELGRHQAELGRREVEVKRLREMLETALSEARAGAHDAGQSRAQLAAVAGSRSWRLTAPLRRMSALARFVRGLGA
jgi:methyltransferase family protein